MVLLIITDIARRRDDVTITIYLIWQGSVDHAKYESQEDLVRVQLWLIALGINHPGITVLGLSNA